MVPDIFTLIFCIFVEVRAVTENVFHVLSDGYMFVIKLMNTGRSRDSIWASYQLNEHKSVIKLVVF